MKSTTKTKIFALLAVLATGVLTANPAHAYIDPGSGSMVIQLLVAAIAGGLFTLKVYWRRLKSHFGLGAKSDGGDDKPKSE